MDGTNLVTIPGAQQYCKSHLTPLTSSSSIMPEAASTWRKILIPRFEKFLRRRLARLKKDEGLMVLMQRMSRSEEGVQMSMA
jgi:hypothetical protein